MSLRGVVKAVIQKLENAANAAGTSAYASMRVAGQPTPCIVFDLSVRHTIPMPNGGAFGGGKRHYDVSVEVACIADDLDSALVLLEDLQAEFPDGGPYTETVGTETPSGAASSVRLSTWACLVERRLRKRRKVARSRTARIERTSRSM